jgi:tRNA/tmRNA/rRNA uracil-C5-methylase (TrmA/RlmC/RlmD family)
MIYMKKGQIYEGYVKRIDFPNKGIIEYEGEKVVVKNCLPGQKVRFAVTKIKSDKAEGSLMEVIEKSALECRDKACKSFGSCGGCSYQTMNYADQLELKKEQVIRLLNQVCDDYCFEGIIGSPVEFGYRNKMEFSFGDEYKGGPLALGLHKKGSFHDILTVDDCRIVDSDFNQILSKVLEYSRELGLDYYHKLTHKGYLRHLLIRKAVKTGEILINIITTTQKAVTENKNGAGEEGSKEKANKETVISEAADREAVDRKIADRGIADNEIADNDITVKETTDIFKELAAGLLKLPLEGKITGILHTYNDSQADVVKSDRTVILYGRDYIYEELLELRFKISTFSFFQTNSLGAEVLYSKVREYVGETRDKSIFDLYSGTGTIAQLLAPVAKKVCGVEIVEEAVEAARENAALNGLTNCEFIAGDVLKVIDSLEDKPDIIVLDPPRDGIHPKALDKIIAFGVDRIVYISCKPTSLIRDLKVLQEKGYKVEKVCAVDMFPETVHVETVVLMCASSQAGKC